MLVALTAGALVLRLVALDQSLYGDELFTYDNTVGRSLGHVVSADLENNPPLFYVLAWGSAKLGDPTTSIRLPSLILGTLTVPLVYALGRRTAGAFAGLIGAAIVALSPFAVAYGVEARAYAALMLFEAAATCALLAALDTGRRRWWVSYAGASLAVLYSHYLGVFVLAAQAAWAVWTHPRARRAVVLCNGAVAILCLPLVPALSGERVTEATVTGATTLKETLRTVYGRSEVPWDELPGPFATYALAIIGAASLVALVVRLVMRRRGGLPATGPSRVVLIALLALASPVGFLLYSIVGSSIGHGRYLLASLPALAVTCGWLLGQLPRALSLVAATAVVVALAAGTVQSFEPRFSRPDYRGAAAFIDREARPGDAIVDTDIASFLAGQAFLSRGIAGRDRTYLAVNLDGDQRVARVSNLITAVVTTREGRRVFLTGREGTIDSPDALPLRPVETRIFDGIRKVVVQVLERTGEETAVTEGLPNPRYVSRLTACLTGQGLPPEPAEAAAGVIRLVLRAGELFLLVFDSADDARRGAEGIQGLAARRGGTAERRGLTVVVYIRGRRDQEVGAIARCLPPGSE